LKKLALVASAATALVCAASLIATPAASQQAYGPGPGPGYAYGPGPGYGSSTNLTPGYGDRPGYGYGPRHDPGGPIRSGNLCWADKDPASNTGQGYWKPCPK
jgi:hypothetical protein